LEDRLDINIRNEGVSGDTTRDALDRLQRDVLRRDPSVVIVFLGGNDEIRRSYDDLSMTLVGRALQDELDEIAEEVNYDWESVPLISRNETFENIETIVERIQDTGAVTIIVGLDNTIFDASINERYRQVARNTDSFFVSDIYDGVFGRPRFMADLVHPNEDGYEIFADRIQPALTCALPN
jgi:acyl-CoA thioesterase-1